MGRVNVMSLFGTCPKCENGKFKLQGQKRNLVIAKCSCCKIRVARDFEGRLHILN